MIVTTLAQGLGTFLTRMLIAWSGEQIGTDDGRRPGRHRLAPRAPFPWRERYCSYGVGLIAMIT